MRFVWRAQAEAELDAAIDYYYFPGWRGGRPLYKIEDALHRPFFTDVVGQIARLQ